VTIVRSNHRFHNECHVLSEEGIVVRRRLKWLAPATITILLAGGCSSIGAGSLGGSNTTGDFQNAVAFQITRGHSGYSPDAVGPTWTRVWSKNLYATLSYPLIVNGNVYVIGFSSVASQQYGTSTLYSINAASGSVNWKLAMPQSSPSFPSNGSESANQDSPGLAYDDGDLFTVTGDVTSDSGTMSAYKASTGASLWSTTLQDQFSFDPPTALDGMVYTSGSGDSATIYAVKASTGELAWDTKLPLGGSFTIPAVSPNDVYVSYAGQEVFDLSPATGDEIWQHSNGDNGGGGATPVLAGNYLLVQDQLLGDCVLDSSTGMVLGTSFKSGPTPAANGDSMFTENAGQLQAEDISTGQIKWTFQGDGNLDTSPILVNHSVYEGSQSGMLFAVSATTGAKQWSTALPAQITANITEGDGYLAVPSSNVLTVFKPAP
jgi:outer membrane protein assembly factor BamB